MPTTRPRYQVTETAEIQHALDLAAQRWPGVPRSRLLVRLVQAGSQSLMAQAEGDRQQRALRRIGDKYAGTFQPNHLDDLRRDWTE